MGLRFPDWGKLAAVKPCPERSDVGGVTMGGGGKDKKPGRQFFIVFVFLFFEGVF